MVELVLFVVARTICVCLCRKTEILAYVSIEKRITKKEKHGGQMEKFVVVVVFFAPLLRQKSIV